jgi:hypothetical protein
VFSSIAGTGSAPQEKDLLTLRNSDILTVDLNDAPKGLTLDQYQDNNRELPSATGVIPVKQFLDALAQIGYEGPIQAEPFNCVAGRADRSGLRRPAAAMKKSQPDVNLNISPGELDLPSAPVLSRIDT